MAQQQIHRSKAKGRQRPGDDNDPDLVETVVVTSPRSAEVSKAAARSLDSIRAVLAA